MKGVAEALKADDGTDAALSEEGHASMMVLSSIALAVEHPGRLIKFVRLMRRFPRRPLMQAQLGAVTNMLISRIIDDSRSKVLPTPQEGAQNEDRDKAADPS